MPHSNSTSNASDAPTSPPTQGPKPKREKKAKAPKAPKPPRVKKEKPVRTTPAHMSKVDKVANQLPALAGDANTLFVAANNMATSDICVLVAHLNIAIRKRGIQTVAQGKAGTLSVGDRVRVRSSQTNPRFIGMVGTVSTVQRIRCYVKLDGRTYPESSKGDYFFITDCEPSSGVSGGSLAETVKRLTSPSPDMDLHTIEDEPEVRMPDTASSSATG